MALAAAVVPDAAATGAGASYLYYGSYCRDNVEDDRVVTVAAAALAAALERQCMTLMMGRSKRGASKKETTMSRHSSVQCSIA
jgi:hypothetical protein